MGKAASRRSKLGHPVGAPTAFHQAWMEDGACTPAGAGETWDPTLHYDDKRVEQAKRVCFSCPVISQCLSFALATKQSSGVWGGRVFTTATRKRSAA